MDARRVDALSRALAAATTRRGLIGVLAALPAAGWLSAHDEVAAGARKRRKSHGARRNHAVDSEKKGKKRKKKPQCQPESAAQTCAGRCGQATNNCGQAVSCGSCACGAACPVCQTCDATTGRCVTNAAFSGLACGLPGQICRADGVCGCDDASCPSGQRCNGIVCVCDAASCPDGGCDGNRVCRVNEPGACGTGGGVCAQCPACQTCTDGVCATDIRQNRTTCQLPAGAGSGVCCNGACCAGCCNASIEHGACGPCLAFMTSATTNGAFGGLAGGFWGSYKAWLSTPIDSPSTRFRCTAASCSAQGYARTDGVSLASDWADLTSCNGGSGECLDAIILSEFNQPITANPTWTNTRPNGTPSIFPNTSCQNWTIGNNTQIGRTGFSELQDAEWTDASADSCNRLDSLYCFQQA